MKKKTVFALRAILSSLQLSTWTIPSVPKFKRPMTNFSSLALTPALCLETTRQLSLESPTMCLESKKEPNTKLWVVRISARSSTPLSRKLNKAIVTPGPSRTSSQSVNSMNTLRSRSRLSTALTPRTSTSLSLAWKHSKLTAPTLANPLTIPSLFLKLRSALPWAKTDAQLLRNTPISLSLMTISVPLNSPFAGVVTLSTTFASLCNSNLLSTSPAYLLYCSALYLSEPLASTLFNFCGSTWSWTLLLLLHLLLRLLKKKSPKIVSRTVTPSSIYSCGAKFTLKLSTNLLLW